MSVHSAKSHTYSTTKSSNITFWLVSLLLNGSARTVSTCDFDTFLSSNELHCFSSKTNGKWHHPLHICKSIRIAAHRIESFMFVGVWCGGEPCNAFGVSWGRAWLRDVEEVCPGCRTGWRRVKNCDSPHRPLENPASGWQNVQPSSHCIQVFKAVNGFV